VREQGTHQQLLALGGSYHRMWQLQTGFDMSADGRLARVEPTRLRAIPLFERLTDAQLAVLADRFVTEQYDADETIFNQGDEGLKFYLLVRGTVEVLKEGKEVEVRRLAVLQDGDFFGEIALLTSARRMASARTRTPCTLLSLDRDQFFGLRSIVPELGMLVERVAMDRLAANSAASHEGI
jgi:ATP-binding cassette subfamily B protein